GSLAFNPQAAIRNWRLECGGGGIRTHEGLRPAGFQDRSHQPLDHPSGFLTGRIVPSRIRSARREEREKPRPATAVASSVYQSCLIYRWTDANVQMNILLCESRRTPKSSGRTCENFPPSREPFPRGNSTPGGLRSIQRTASRRSILKKIRMMKSMKI